MTGPIDTKFGTYPDSSGKVEIDLGDLNKLAPWVETTECEGILRAELLKGGQHFKSVMKAVNRSGQKFGKNIYLLYARNQNQNRFIRSYSRPRRRAAKTIYLVAVAEATWMRAKAIVMKVRSWERLFWKLREGRWPERGRWLLVCQRTVANLRRVIKV